MNLILLEPSEVAGAAVTLRDHRARHARDVLKATPGATIRIGIINGRTGVGTVTRTNEQIIEMDCEFDEMPPVPRLDLLLALPRPKVMRRLWAQLSALGVGRIILTNAERVERNYFDTHLLAPDVYRPLLIEGLQQARDTRLPIVTIHRQFRVLIEDELDAMAGDAVRVVADPHGRAPIRDVVTSARADRVLLAVGPEGGWNEFELSLLAGRGFRSASMGPRTLRTDTACIALLALAQHAIHES
jgi:16S rRNA (uracil1498-N3)-methyltransferase